MMAILPILAPRWFRDRKSTRLNSSHLVISYAVFCLKKKTHKPRNSLVVSGFLARQQRSALVCACCSSSLLADHAYIKSPSHPLSVVLFLFFFNDRATPEFYPLSLHAALPI